MTDGSLTMRLKTLIAFRVVFVTVLLGSFFVLRIGDRVLPYPAAVLYLIILLYVASIIYLVLLDRVPNRVLAYAQIAVDAVAINALIVFTGGIESWFSSLLLLIVIYSAIVMGKRAGYTAAVMASILYGALIDLQFYGVIPIDFAQGLEVKDFLYKIFSHLLALFLTAYLTGYLSSRIERRDMDIEDLTLFNREVIESTPSGLFTTDVEGNIRLFNRAAESITGYGRSEVAGADVRLVFPFIVDLTEQKRMEATVRFGEAERVIGSSISRMKDTKGEDTGYIGIFQDLTELKKMAEEMKKKEKLAAIGELSANMAHEIRNPLASLKSSIEMLTEGVIPEAQKERLMTIALHEMDRLNSIIDDFLGYSRPTPVVMEEFDLHGALEDTLEFLENRDHADIVFRRRFSGPFRVKADAGKLQQVFWNLGINALDAMPEGGSLTVGTGARNGLVEISFEDTGKGIAREDLERIFFPFYTTKNTGTGLGLSIAYRIVEDHKGILTVRSVPGQGARFDILLPRDA
ncbi:MAG: ATP-binding protein [Nitrospirota bacterium]|jgi:two-component system sensor histidine kinase PilS (NtrC family)